MFYSEFKDVVIDENPNEETVAKLIARLQKDENIPPILVDVVYSDSGESFAKGIIYGVNELEAYRRIAAGHEDEDLDEAMDKFGDIAENVANVVETYCGENDCVLGSHDFPYEHLRTLFEGTEIEKLMRPFMNDDDFDIGWNW